MTLSALLSDLVDRLSGAGVESARLDAECIIRHVCSFPRHVFIADPFREIAASDAAICLALSARRENKEPIAYILQEKEFYGLSFYVDRRVLIPRPDTELLVETALSLLPKGGRLLDICTGSGAVAAAVAYECPDCSVTASDISEDALAVATLNGERLVPGRITFVRSDLFAAFAGEQFDCITANPPYVSSELEGTLQPELSFEPGLALYAKDKGLVIIEEIIKQFPTFLKDGGALAMEIGFDQGDAVRAMALAAGAECSVMKDLSGNDRTAVLRI